MFFHNLKGYDAPFIIRQAYDLVGKDKIDVIPTSKEKFMAFTIGKLKFKDSYAFMASKLETLVEHLVLKENDKKQGFINDPNFDPYKHFHNMKRRFNKEEMNLINKKRYIPIRVC
mgnify:CR=1 FL=1